MYCTNCGDKTGQNAKFCQNCGHAIYIGATVASEKPAVNSASENTSQAQHTHEIHAVPVSENVNRDASRRQRLTINIGSYFVRHLNGDLTLAVSFWVNLIFISFLVMLFFYGLMNFGVFSEVESAAKFAKTYSVFTTFVLSPWQLIGTWRAAKRHVSNTGKTIWPTIVMLIVLLFALLRIFQYFQGPQVI